jgi:hypothetical protein
VFEYIEEEYSVKRGLLERKLVWKMSMKNSDPTFCSEGYCLVGRIHPLCIVEFSKC